MILGSDCGPGIATEPWPFTATSAAEDYLSCAVFLGGMLINAKGPGADGAAGLGVDCTSHPGM